MTTPFESDMLRDLLRELDKAEERAETLPEKFTIATMRREISRAARNARKRTLDWESDGHAFRIDGHFGVMLENGQPFFQNQVYSGFSYIGEEVKLDGKTVEMGKEVDRDFAHALHKELRMADAGAPMTKEQDALPCTLRTVGGEEVLSMKGELTGFFLRFDGTWDREGLSSLHARPREYNNQVRENSIWTDYRALSEEAPDGSVVAHVVVNSLRLFTKRDGKWYGFNGAHDELPEPIFGGRYRLCNWGR